MKVSVSWMCVCFRAASCVRDYPASSRCQISHLQMSGGSEGRGGQKEEETGEELVLQTSGTCPDGSSPAAQTDAHRMEDPSSKTQNRTKLHLTEMFTGMFHWCVFAYYLLSSLLQELGIGLWEAGVRHALNCALRGKIHQRENHLAD